MRDKHKSVLVEVLGLDDLWPHLDGCEFQVSSIADVFPSLAKVTSRLKPDDREAMAAASTD
jgi:hypothetical protein